MLLDSTQNKQKILAEALKIAHQSGFSQENLALACVNSQIDAKYLSIIFSGGVDDLLQFMQEQQMLEIQTIASANELFDGLKISEKISFLLEQYFSYQLNQPIIVKHILQYFSKNCNFGQQEVNKKITSLKILANISDSFWKIAKDQSTDFSYYTKRTTLALVIAKVAMVFANEVSDLNCTQTEIAKQINRIVLFAKYKYQTKQQTKHILQNLQDSLKEVVFDDKQQIKTPKEILKSLPFIRLWNL